MLSIAPKSEPAVTFGPWLSPALTTFTLAPPALAPPTLAGAAGQTSPAAGPGTHASGGQRAVRLGPSPARQAGPGQCGAAGQSETGEVMPVGWRLVGGSVVSTAAQWFGRYRNEAGQELSLHRCTGLGVAIERPLLARLRRDGHTITVHRAGAGFEARWGSGEAACSLTGALSLAAFMTVLYGLTLGPCPAAATPV